LNSEQVIQGRLVRPEELAQIRAWLAANPQAHRTRLSRELCLKWNWRNHAGQLKDMACRTLLLKLEAQGHLELPARRRAPVNGQRHRQLAELEHELSPIECGLEALRPIRLELVCEGSAGAVLFRFLLQRYHYLGHRTCVGENLKYLARDRWGRPLACLLFGSAAWKAAARDHWIGWEVQQRARNLHLLTNNTRFLVVPWVQVPHLASHVLAQVSSRLSADWQAKYGHPIYLLETFVECERFRATCYRAAGWRHLGVTTGRTRNDEGVGRRVPIKAIYVKALWPDAQRRLQQ
jgi:hypothetical protein